MNAAFRIPLINVERAGALSGELIWTAQEHARAGRPVFPCGPSKKPLIKGGFKSATTDCRQIERWWRQWPLAMIGMPTGAISGFDVLDVDHKGDVNGFDTLREMGVTIPAEIVEVRTPSGGSHFYFAHEPGRRNSAGKYGQGLDVRGDGGYIILPPSRPSLDASDYHYAEGQTADSLGVPRGALAWL